MLPLNLSNMLLRLSQLAKVTVPSSKRAVAVMRSAVRLVFVVFILFFFLLERLHTLIQDAHSTTKAYSIPNTVGFL